MSDLAFNRLFSEICLYFAVISIIPYWENAQVLLLLCALVCGLAAYFASKVNSTVLRIFIGLLPLLIIALADGQIQMYGLAIVIFYTFVICASGKFYIPYWNYKMVFGLCAVGYGIFLLITMNSPLNSNNAAIFGLLFLVNGVIGLRRARMGSGLDLRGKAYNALEIIGVVLVASIGMMTLYFILVNSTKIVEMILMPFALLFFGIGEIAVKLGSLFKYTPPEMSEVVEEIEEVVENPLEEFVQEIEQSTQDIIAGLPESFWRAIVLIGLAILVAILIYKVTQSFTDKTEEKVVFGNVDSYFEKRKKKKLNLVISNAEKIRNVYRDYLALIKRKGVIIKKSNTTEDILLKAETVGDEEIASKLRELYVKARYAKEQDISDEEVSLAKEYFAKLSASINIKNVYN